MPLFGGLYPPEGALALPAQSGASAPDAPKAVAFGTASFVPGDMRAGNAFDPPVPKHWWV
jgi:hypothetical protein